MKNKLKEMKQDLYISYVVCLVLLIGVIFSNMINWNWLRTVFAVGFMFTLIDTLFDHWKYYKSKKASPN